MRWFCLFAVLGFPIAAHAAGVVILITPKCPLDPKTVKFGYRNSFDLYRPLNSTLNERGFEDEPTLVQAASIKEFEAKLETFVVELLATETKPGTRTMSLRRPGATAESPVTFKVVALKQPYVIWYVEKAGAAPVKVAEATALGEGQSLKSIGASEYELRKMTNDEMAREGLTTLHEGIANHIVDVLADKVFTAKPLYPTEAQLRGSPQSYNPVSRYPYFKPKKIKYGPKGDATIEIELHNRLPVTANGLIKRTWTDAERTTYEALEKAGKKVERNDYVKFVLAPDEKKTVSITVPAELVTNAKHTGGSYLQLAPDFRLYRPAKQ